MDPLFARSSGAEFQEVGKQELFRRLVAKAVRILFAPQVLALADQALVSAASFLTTVMIGRYTFPSQLGMYALAGSVLIWLTNAQESLVSLPYTIHRSSTQEIAAKQAGQALVLTALLSALAVLAICTGVGIVVLSGIHREVLVPILVALAAAAPFVIHRDFARRYAFANHSNIEALAFDGGVVCFQLGALGWLAWSGRLSSVTALAALGAACAIAALFWLGLVRSRFQFTHDGLLATLHGSWSFGRWLFANQVLAAVQSQMTLWLVALAVSASATGVYTACLSIALFANPLILGISNMLWAKSARAFEEGGGGRLLRESITDAAQLGAIVGLFCVAIFVWGHDVLRLLYPRHSYADYAHVVTILALGQFVYGIGIPASTALASTGHVRTNFIIAAGETVLLGILVTPLVFHWGILGAAYGVLIGSVLRFLIRWTALLIVLRRMPWTKVDETGLERLAALQRRVAPKAEPLKPEKLDYLDGSQGHVFVTSCESTSDPSVAAPVFKLYRPDRHVEPAEVRAQYDSFRNLHAKLNGNVFNGWTICIPAPILFSEAPLAVVMTRVPGRKLVDYLRDSSGEAWSESQVVEAVAAALIKLWSGGLCHGDLTVDNILCDAHARTFSFVDCGQKCECSAYASKCEPLDLAVHDLAHLVSYESAAYFKAALRFKERQRRQLFLEGVLRAILASEPSYPGKARLLTELSVCARAHLDEPMRISRILWQAPKRWFALRRVSAILDRMTREIAIAGGSIRGLESGLPRSNSEQNDE
jgi:O-antigen/teichoic acid export membrane protein